MSVSHRSRTRHAACLLAAALMHTAHAGVTRSDDTAPSAPALGSVPVGLESPAAPSTPPDLGTPQDKTIELLLQLQNQSPSGALPDGSTRARSTGADRGPLPATQAEIGTTGSAPDVNPLLSIKEAVLGPAGPGKMEEPNARVVSQRDDPDRFSEPSPRTPSRSAATHSAAGPGLLSHPAIRFIRENRVLVIVASLALLAGFWFTANYRSRSGRRR